MITGVVLIILALALLLVVWMMGHPQPEPCGDERCDGKEHRCPSCAGYGYRQIDWENPDAGQLQCDECNGAGSSPCPVYAANQANAR